MKKIFILLLLMCFLSEFIFAQTYPGTPVSNPVRTYTQNDTKGVWVIGNGAPIFSPTAKMSQLYFDYIGQKPYFWNGSAWVDWSAGYIISAANGLTETAGTVKIGGPLIEETTIDLDGNDFIISGTGRFTVDLTSNIQLQTGGNFDLLADGKLQTFTLANMEVYAAQDIAIETDDVINIHAINGGSIIVDNNDFVLTATSGDVQINSPGTTAGVVNGIAYKSDIANSVAVTDYGVNTTTAGVPDNGKVWTYNSTTNEMELQTLPSAIPGLNTIGSNQLTSGLRDSIALNNWNTLGNAGTVQATNFIGTTDAIGLSLRTNNSIRQTILSTGEVGIGTTTPSTKLEVRTDALGTSQVTTAGIALTNETAAASGLQQISPAMRWKGYGWKTTATAASQAVEFRAYTLPLQGTTAPTGTWVLQSAINGGSYADRFSVSTSGVVGASSYNAANNGSFYWGARSALTSPSDGMLLISNNAVTDFSRLQFGGTTSSFPSLKRSSATLQVRLADDSDYADLSAARLIANNVVRLKGYTVATLPAGTQGDTAFVTDALAPAYMVAVVGGGAVVTPVFYNGTTWLVH